MIKLISGCAVVVVHKISNESLHTILVTGAGGPAGVNTVFSLKRMRLLRVITTDIADVCEGAFLSDKHYVISPASQEEEFLGDLANIVREENVKLIIPTVDEEIMTLVKRKNTIDYYSKIVIHPRNTVEICLNKIKTYEYLGRVMHDLIPEYSLNPRDLFSKVVIKKPIVGRGSRNIQIGRKDEMREERGYFFIEYLPGKEWTVDVLTDKEGYPIAIVPRIRLKTRGGVSVIGYVKLDNTIIEYTKKILNTLKFAGPLNIQFKEDIDSNPKLLEINPRFSGGLDITIAAGADLPKILVEYWLFNKKPRSLVIREGIYVKIYRVLRNSEIVFVKRESLNNEDLERGFYS